MDGKTTFDKKLMYVVYSLLLMLFISELSIAVYFNDKIETYHSQNIQIAEELRIKLDGLTLSVNNLFYRDNPSFDYKWTSTSDGIIAHGMGGIEGHYRTNSLEAFINAYDRGVRVFEADIHTTKDGIPVLYHDFNSWSEMVETNDELSYELFMDSLLYEKYHTLDVRKLCELMNTYEDVYIVIDYGAPIGYENKLWYSSLAYWGNEFNVMDRFIIEITDEETLKDASSIYPWKSYVFTYYIEKWKSENEAIEFCQNNRIEIVNLTKHQYDAYGIKNWISNDIKVCVFTINDNEEAERLYDAGVTAIYTDILYE